MFRSIVWDALMVLASLLLITDPIRIIHCTQYASLHSLSAARAQGHKYGYTGKVMVDGKNLS